MIKAALVLTKMYTTQTYYCAYNLISKAH
uniref:Uncharacterized protein n=1 Tax=Anguilla anguilla TaxID=7936 RepID=A0A0E9QUX6_ANGAN